MIMHIMIMYGLGWASVLILCPIYIRQNWYGSRYSISSEILARLMNLVIKCI